MTATNLAHTQTPPPRFQPTRESVTAPGPSWALVVAVNDACCAEVTALLEREGIETHQTRQWSNATELLRGRAPDLVIFVGQSAARDPLAELPNASVVWLPAPVPQANNDNEGGLPRGAVVALQAAVVAARRYDPCAEDTAQVPRPREPLHLDMTNGKLHKGLEGVRVTPTERDLLRVLLAGRGQWIPSDELKLRAFGPEHRSQDSLIRVHVHNLRKKLAELSLRIDSVRGVGYRLP